MNTQPALYSHQMNGEMETSQSNTRTKWNVRWTHTPSLALTPNEWSRQKHCQPCTCTNSKAETMETQRVTEWKMLDGRQRGIERERDEKYGQPVTEQTWDKKEKRTGTDHQEVCCSFSAVLQQRTHPGCVCEDNIVVSTSWLGGTDAAENCKGNNP